MEKTVKNAKIIIAFVCAYALLNILGAAINSAAYNESFGSFLQSIFGGVYGVFVFAMWIVLIWAIKVLKNKETILSEKVVGWIFAGFFVWIFCGALYTYTNYITNSIKYISYQISDYSIGSLIINVMWVITTIVVFILLDFHKVIGNFVKDMKGEKPVVIEPVAEPTAEPTAETNVGDESGEQTKSKKEKKAKNADEIK